MQLATSSVVWRLLRQNAKKGRRRWVDRLLPFWVIELFICCLVSAVTYSPTTSRLQYHQRVQA